MISDIELDEIGVAGRKVNQVSCHHKLETNLDAYIATAGILEDNKGVLFRSAVVRSGKL